MAKRRERIRKERRSNLVDLSVPTTEVVLEVLQHEDGARLDGFIAARFDWRSKTQIQGWIKDGIVSVDGRSSVKKSTKLVEGDRVRIQVPEPKEEVRHEQLAAELVVLHEDEDLIAVNKPPNLVVHPVGRVRHNTLIQALHWFFRHGEGARPGARVVIPKICHRLDKDTSGVMIVAKNDRARADIQRIFEARELDKSYLALLEGRVEFDTRVVDQPLGPDPAGTHGMRMAVVPGGLPSRSVFKAREVFREASFCEVAIETGRQHQIRVHAAWLGHPVLHDALYGPTFDPAQPRERSEDEDESRGATEPEGPRQALHAWRLRLPHPRTGETLDLVADLPDDMSRWLTELREESQA